MPLSLVLHAVVIASMLLAACAAVELGSAVDKDPDRRLPSAAARSAATTYGTLCYSVRHRSDSTFSMNGCPTQDWENGELQALRSGEFVFPMSETDLRGLYAKALDKRGLLREKTIEKMYETLPKPNTGGPTLRDRIELNLINSVIRNLMSGGEFDSVQGVVYWARFCANTMDDVCWQSATAASWEANAARLVFQPIGR